MAVGRHPKLGSGTKEDLRDKKILREKKKEKKRTIQERELPTLLALVNFCNNNFQNNLIYLY